MNLARETVSDRFVAVEAVSVTDDELSQLEGGYMNISGQPLLVVKILDMFRTPPTVPVRTPPSPG